MDAIHLEDLAFYAYHGVHDEEARLGQRFHIDLSCDIDLAKVSRSDAYADTVCYGLLVKTVEDVVTKSRFRLIEKLAGAIADSVLDADARITKVRVRVHKPGAPLPIASGRVSVELTRVRMPD